MKSVARNILLFVTVGAVTTCSGCARHDVDSEIIPMYSVDYSDENTDDVYQSNFDTIDSNSYLDIFDNASEYVEESHAEDPVIEEVIDTPEDLSFYTEPYHEEYVEYQLTSEVEAEKEPEIVEYEEEYHPVEDEIVDQGIGVISSYPEPELSDFEETYDVENHEVIEEGIIEIPSYPEPEVAPEVTPVPDDFYSYVNGDYYNNMVSAKEAFDQLLSNGSVAAQIINRGNSLSSDECSFVDHSISNIYQNICNYINSYNVNDVVGCYNSGINLTHEYDSGLGFTNVSNLLIARSLPSPYQSEIVTNEGYGNYRLNNGYLIHLLGSDSDTLLSYSNNADSYTRSLWYRDLPSVITNHYTSIRSVNGDDGVCYFLNDVKTDHLCTNEWNNIKNEDSAIYGFDPSITSVIFSGDVNSYVYVDYDSNVYGSLSTEKSIRVEHILMVQDALACHEADVSNLDSALRDMYTIESNKVYSR